MKLRDWLEREQVSFSELAGAIERTGEAVRRYASGERIPDRETMPRIVKATRGEVTANDFFDIDDSCEVEGIDSQSSCGLSPDIAAGIIDPAAEPFHSEGTGIAQFAGPSGRPPHPLRSQVDAGQPAAPALEQGLPPLDGADAAGDRLGGAQ